MKKLLIAVAALAAASCAKQLGSSDAGNYVVARFDPSQSPPVVPSPNDLAFDADSGTLQIPLGANASDADKNLAAYLDTLDGFPADSPATMTFTGRLDAGSVTPKSVQTYDITSGALIAVNSVSPAYADRTLLGDGGAPVPDATAPGEVTLVPPAGGWISGHTYAVAVIGGEHADALRGANSEEVIGSDSWALARSSNSLVTCPAPYTAADCRAATNLFPSVYTDPQQRIADQLKTAIQLEAVRLHYKPTLDQLDALGYPRADIAQLFSFKIVDDAVTPAYTLDPDPCKVNVPLPNDLAIDPATGLLATPTTCAGLTASSAEFRADYLNHLNGYPTASFATESFVGGNLATPAAGVGPTANASGSGLVVLDLSSSNAAVAPAATGYTIDTQGTGTLSIAPPAGGWIKGHDYAVGLIGGAQGLRGSGGEQVIASDQFALVRSTASLVTCADLTSPGCHATLTLVPVTDAQAVQLEGVRLTLKPGLDALEAQGVPRASVAAFWSFKITSNPEVTFDLLSQTIPFPNDGRDLSQFHQPFLLWIPDGGVNGGPRVNLPVPAGSPPAAAALIAGLNTLDGFSTSAPIVSENGYATGALTDGARLDPTTLVAGATVGLFNLDDAGAPPTYQVCVSCALPSGYLDAGSGEPDELEIVPATPLAERNGYGAYITTDLKSSSGVGVAPNVEFALIRMRNPIVDPSTGQLTIGELVGALDLADAAVIESLRQQYASLIDEVSARSGRPRAQLALAWDFHTETTASGLPPFGAIPAALESASSGASATPAYVYDGTSTVKAQATGFDLSSVNAIYLAAIDTPFYFSDGSGNYDPAGDFDGAHEHTQRQQLIITIPTGTPPSGGWPVAIFGHGFTRQRLDVLALANTFASKGIAAVAFDLPYHGDRSFCVGAHQAITLPDGGASASDDDACFPGGVCESDPADPSYGRCVSPARSSTGCTALTSLTFAAALVIGELTSSEGDLFCQAGGKSSGSTYADNLGHCLTSGPNAGYCEGSYFAEADGSSPPVISGWDFIDPTNFFATRDHFRSTSIDLNEVVEVLKYTGSGSLASSLTGNNALNASNINYVGMSLGGITGVSAATVAPALNNLVFNVTGGDLTGLLLRSPGLAVLRAPTLAGLAQLGIVPGQGNFDQFVNFAQWVLDPADPINFVDALDAPPAPAGRKSLLQFIEGDTIVANFSSEQLIDIANADGSDQQLSWTYYDSAHYTLPYEPLPTTTNRHGFLLVPGVNGPASAQATTTAAQDEAAGWVLNGTSSTAQAGQFP